MWRRLDFCKLQRFIVLLCVLCCLTSCVSRMGDLFAPKKLAIAEIGPQLSFEQEAMALQMSEVLEQSDLSSEEKADLYFERAVIYDSLGLWALARNDFSLAVDLVPKMASAYNYLGLYLLLEGDYDSAMDIFNAVLELEPQYDYVHLNRGLALYYSGRYAEAERDLLAFYQRNESDPYRVLWLYFNELELSPNQAQANLTKRSEQLSQAFWGTKIVSYFLGQLSLEELRASIEAEAKPNTLKYAEMLTETYFYLAKQTLKLNQTTEAIALFRLAIANQVYNFVEYRFALFELARLRQVQALPVVGQ